MPAARIHVSEIDLRNRILQQLRSGASSDASAVVWSDADAEILVLLSSLAVRVTGGWLVVDLDLETLETGRVPVRCVFFLGGEGRADGLKAAGKIVPGVPSILMARWGDTLLSAVWSGVLDVLEGALQAASSAFPDHQPTLTGYASGEGSLQISFTL